MAGEANTKQGSTDNTTSAVLPGYLVGAVVRISETNHACATCGREIETVTDPDHPLFGDPLQEWCSGYSELCMSNLL